MLTELAANLRQTLGILHKQDIQPVAHHLGRWVPDNTTDSPIWLGDDCAAIPDGEGYLLLAAEGMWSVLVETEPWFAGWCGVLVNVSDIYAMGGKPVAVVDALWSRSVEQSQQIWEGMKAASKAFNVPIVGGHTHCHSPYEALSVAILGRAQHLITSFNAQLGDTLLLVTDFNGKPHPKYPFWDAATMAEPAVLQANLDLLPTLAAAGLCDAGKDVSMGGLVGTLLMLLETSGCGAILDLDCVPVPSSLSLEQWLVSFPSYGFLLSVRPKKVASIQTLFRQQELVCDAIGQITEGQALTFQAGSKSTCFWNLSQDPLTGFSKL
ncbi:Phosphoribosylformylglycinamidine synthase subunit PurL [Acaryochloris thomasi RCC1774]|uniref:Phosphoribosylformylglycinamidine synthase subunit PurL n=1 Tax=Acaryochloris thomasi RCC1774 TaxID=1764569 RepID=A0A2W1JLQ0_9CYAN|nr:sll0787 family AIR synthase-like protein [Acaryochloris thomasi]PZD74219.1 Phosphoribosylformylglycinamidine synthase subunit PurL [Acaryochloris thomasi RCC1774]